MQTRLIGALAAACALIPAANAAAATTTVPVGEAEVTRSTENVPVTGSWGLYTRAGTPDTAGVFDDAAAAIGDGSLHLNTATGSEKVFLFNYDHVGTALAGVDAISYATNRTAGSANQLPALNIQVDYNGDADGGFTTLVFEPVYNLAQQPVANGTWQTWTAAGSGRWWSTRAINGQPAGAAAVNLRTWDQIVANNEDATILGGFGVNQGSGNGGLDAAVDALSLTIGEDTTVYDFEPDTDGDGHTNGADNCADVANPGQQDFDNDGIGAACDESEQPANKDECKNGGWVNFTGPVFKNQGDCVSSAPKR
jgi:Thrombospondin type 3 repeat